MFDRSALPKEVTVYEVGPRDGLQNESVVLATSVKADLIRRLVASGIPAIEVASFVRGDIVPAMADARRVVNANCPPVTHTSDECTGPQSKRT